MNKMVIGELENACFYRCTAFPVLVGALLLAGCAIPKEPNWSPDEHSVPELTLVLAPGDEIGVTFLGAPDLNTTQRIRRDGCISLNLVGDYKAAGKTPQQVKQELLKLYATQIQVKETEISITSPSPVFVAGAVTNPGRLETDRPLTALEAIMEMGGFNEKESNVRGVVVIRHGNGERWGYYLDFNDALKGKECRPFYLKSFDIVYVPRRPIVKVNDWVEQYIHKLLPHTGARYQSGDMWLPL